MGSVSRAMIDLSLGFVVFILLLTIGVEVLRFIVDSYWRHGRVGARSLNEQVQIIVAYIHTQDSATRW